MRFYTSLVLCPLLASVISGCGPSVPKAKFYHAQHGVVTSDDARLAAVRNSCGKTAYADGVTIDGKVVTDRDVVLKAWSQHLVDQVMAPGAGAIAGTQGALAVSSGDPSIATQYSAPSTSSFKKPPYDARMNELEKKTWDCVNKNGWTKQT